MYAEPTPCVQRPCAVAVLWVVPRTGQFRRQILEPEYYVSIIPLGGFINVVLPINIGKLMANSDYCTLRRTFMSLSPRLKVNQVDMPCQVVYAALSNRARGSRSKHAHWVVAVETPNSGF